MLFVSPIRARVFNHESAGVSASINAILEKVTATPGINRKQLAEQLAPAGAEPADLERAKFSLASDLHWLVSEGYVIEFNDGSLDLPRTKPPAAPAAQNGETSRRRCEATRPRRVQLIEPTKPTLGDSAESRNKPSRGRDVIVKRDAADEWSQPSSDARVQLSRCEQAEIVLAQTDRTRRLSVVEPMRFSVRATDSQA